MKKWPRLQIIPTNEWNDAEKKNRYRSCFDVEL